MIWGKIGVASLSLLSLCLAALGFRKPRWRARRQGAGACAFRCATSRTLAFALGVYSRLQWVPKSTSAERTARMNCSYWQESTI